MKKIFVVLFLLSLASVAHAEIKSITDIIEGDDEGGDVTRRGYWDWASLAGIALVVSAIILAFIYLWGTMFRNVQMVSYVKLEMYELVVSALLVVLVLGVVGALSNLEIGSLLPGEFIPSGPGTISGYYEGCRISPTDTIYEISEVYFDKCVEEDMSAWLNMNYILNMYVDMAASITPYARPLGIGLISSPLAGMASPLKQLLYNATTGLTIAYVMNYAQYYTFVFAVDVLLLYYLPIGVFLRSFLPTRRLGGTIIGVSLSFLLVFPLLTTFAFILFYNDTGPLITFRGFTTAYLADIDFTGMLEEYTNPDNYKGFVTLFTGVLGGIGTMLQKVIGAVFAIAMMFPISVVGKAFVIGYVIPAFNVMMFVQATIALSKSFGDEIDVGALTRMI